MRVFLVGAIFAWLAGANQYRVTEHIGYLMFAGSIIALAQDILEIRKGLK